MLGLTTKVTLDDPWWLEPTSVHKQRPRAHSANFTCNYVSEELGEKSMLLRDALAVTRREMVSLIGASGKTDIMLRLAKELRDQGCKVLVTTTTQIIKPTKPDVDRLFLVEEIQALTDICGGIAAPAIVGAGRGLDQEVNLRGMPVAWLDRLNREALFDAILVEADGAASGLLKIPGEGEPLIPQNCQTAVWVVAVKVLGKPLPNAWIRGSARAGDLIESPADASAGEDKLIQLIQHRDSCLKGIPSGSRKIAVINQADCPAEIAAAQALGDKLQRQGFERVVITSYTGVEPVIQAMAH